MLMALFPPEKGACKKYKQVLDVYTIPADTKDEFAETFQKIDEKR